MATIKEWKQNMMLAREIRAKTAGLIYDRLKLLVDVYHDQEFRADTGVNDLSAAETLDAELADVCAGFLELKAVLELFPSRSQWEGRKLQEMVAEALEQERASRKQATEPKTVVRITKATFEKVDSERKRAVAAAENLTSQLRGLQKENERLKSELAVAKYRIEELAGTLNRSQAMA